MAFAKKTPTGRWRGVAKDGRVEIGSKTFDLKRDAVAWAERQEAAARGGVDVKAGRARLGALFPEWLESRKHAVAPATIDGDKRAIARVTPTLASRSVGSVTSRDVERWLLHLRSDEGLADGSISRYRASLSAFFEWTVKDGRRPDNPVLEAPAPLTIREQRGILPLTEDELTAAVERVAEISEHYALIVYVLAWTGLRWGEARALRVSDIHFGDTASIHVSRSQSEGRDVKTVKGRTARRVPMPDHVAEAVEKLTASQPRSGLALTTPNGNQLWKSRFVKPIPWKEISGGRSLHDLRHTAATLWLSRGVDLATVSAWLGHATVSTTNRYLHYLGDASDRAAVGLLAAGGAPVGREPEPELPRLRLIQGGLEPHEPHQWLSWGHPPVPRKHRDQRVPLSA